MGDERVKVLLGTEKLPRRKFHLLKRQSGADCILMSSSKQLKPSGFSVILASSFSVIHHLGEHLVLLWT